MLVSVPKANAYYPVGTRDLITVFITVSTEGDQKYFCPRFAAVYQFHTEPPKFESCSCPRVEQEELSAKTHLSCRQGLETIRNKVNNFIVLLLVYKSRDSAVGIATGHGLDDRGPRIFTSPCRPDWLWIPPSLLADGYRGLLPWG
jgi:hypothetical protein